MFERLVNILGTNFPLKYTILYVFIGFYFYAIFSNPQLFLSFIRKRFSRYFFEKQKMERVVFFKPIALPRFFIFLTAIREIYNIVLRFHFIDKIFRIRRRKHYSFIYRTIVQKRFNPFNPYLTAGDHFSSFYPRNLGFFYSKSLNPETAVTTKDYQNRVCVYLNSLNFALDFYSQTSLTTTIVPIFRSFFCPLDIYHPPSDTLCSILLAFDYLINPTIYNFKTTKISIKNFQQEAKRRALILFQEHKKELSTHLHELLSKFDSDTGLIDQKHSLSGIRDGLKRKSSFYENVAVWKTIQLSIKFNLIKEEDLRTWENPEFLKESIIEEYCRNGIIYNDQSEDEELIKNISADFLVSNSLNFFDLKNKRDRKILIDHLDFTINSNLLTPIGLFYSLENPKTLELPVKIGAPDYMGQTVWSHWSVEFCNLLLDLKEKKYKELAISVFQNLYEKIESNKGYPELYSKNLNLYKTKFYVSMLDTGWIANFENLRLRLKK